MIVTGTDLIEIDRITNTLETYGERFLKRIYTQHEIDFCNEQLIIEKNKNEK